MKKRDFFVISSSSHLKITRTLRVLWLNKMRPASQQKKKKMKKKIFSAFITTTRLQFPRTLPVFCWKASHRNAKGIIGFYSTMGSEWGQLHNKKKKKWKKRFFQHLSVVTRLKVSTNIACFVVEQSVSQKCQGHHWMQNWMLYSTMGSEWGQLGKKKKKNEKKDFFSIYHYHPVTVSTNIACFLVEPSVSQKCQGHHWM